MNRRRIAVSNNNINASISKIMTHSHKHFGGARGVMVIVVGNGHGNMSSNPRRDWLHFTLH